MEAFWLMVDLDIRNLAIDLVRDLGDAANDAARARAIDLGSHGDDHGAAVWREVAAELDRRKRVAD
jgi:hypothetical protein